MPVDIHNFVLMRYFNCQEAQQEFQRIEDYKQHYLDTVGIREWLESMSDQDVSLELVHNIARTFITLCGKNPIIMPEIFKMLEKQYSIRLPNNNAILTQAYWQEAAVRSKWV